MREEKIASSHSATCSCGACWDGRNGITAGGSAKNDVKSAGWYSWVKLAGYSLALDLFGRTFSVFFAIAASAGSNGSGFGQKLLTGLAAVMVYATSLGVMVFGDAAGYRIVGEIANFFWCYLVTYAIWFGTKMFLRPENRIGRMTNKEARTLVMQHLQSRSTNLIVVDEMIRTEDFGWVFYYASKKDLDTATPSAATADHPPIIVDGFDGSLHVTGIVEPIENYIQRYRRERGSQVSIRPSD